MFLFDCGRFIQIHGQFSYLLGNTGTNMLRSTKLHVVPQIAMSTANFTNKFGLENNLQPPIPYSVLADFEPNRSMLIVFSSLKINTFLNPKAKQIIFKKD